MPHNKSESLIGTRPEDRTLTDAERTLLEWLIGHGGREALQYGPQALLARVVATCSWVVDVRPSTLLPAMATMERLGSLVQDACSVRMCAQGQANF
jgi:hypothetical protein